MPDGKQDEQMTAEQAITRSVSHNEIVTLGTAADSLNGEEAVAVMAELFSKCEDCVDTDNRGAKAEYWGKDESGNEWRVHVWFDSVSR